MEVITPRHIRFSTHVMVMNVDRKILRHPEDAKLAWAKPPQ